VRAILLLGFLIGMRHALEADHLAAVASLATGGRSARSAAFQGAIWGLGHTITLFIVGGTCLLVSAAIPDRMMRLAEGVVGLMLLYLGGEVLWRLRRRGIHLHGHGHDDGTVHVHAHAHPSPSIEAAQHDPHHHRHSHAGGFPRRALVVGLVHGVAGSAALLLLTLNTVGSFWWGLAYIGVFGLGSIAGMALLSTAIALPLKFSARLLSRGYHAIEGAVGVGAVALGLWVLWQAAVAAGIP
jgi:sulfite exporter TauE/SafE